MLKEEIIKREVENSLQVLKSGGTLLYPTDTIWGLGCDALNESAIEKIYLIKKRPAEKNLIILLHDESLLMKYVREVPEPAWDLVSYSERPLTIIYPGAINLPGILTGTSRTIGIRIVKTGFVFNLLRKLNRPLISTSANISDRPTALRFEEIDPLILGSVDYVVDLQAASDVIPKPSVIMQIETNGRFKFIRR